MKTMGLKGVPAASLLGLCLLASGCGTFQSGVTWAPERMAYQTNGDGEVARVEQYDDDGVCRRILFYREDGKLKLVQERDAAGVCRRATYYDAEGRVSRVQSRDAEGSLTDTMRFSASGSPAASD
jgi:hypothetical protein